MAIRLSSPLSFRAVLCAAVPVAGLLLLLALHKADPATGKTSVAEGSAGAPVASPLYESRRPLDISGLGLMLKSVPPWDPHASLPVIARLWKDVGYRSATAIDRVLAASNPQGEARLSLLLDKIACFLYEGRAERAYQVSQQARALVERDPALARQWLYSVIYLQGVIGMRLGENENCVRCRGASACIIPFNPAAVHVHQRGSRLAVKHFMEYLREFPDDFAVSWLLNLAHTTLGEYPDKVDPRFRLPLDHFAHSEFDIGKFRDISYLVGLDRINEAGGAIMDDFDNDGMLDLVVTSFDPNQAMGYFHNTGDGHFQDRTASAGLSGQLGGLYCVQGDYNNDGLLDIYIPRGAWQKYPMRPSLLRNNGDGTFTDVTAKAGLLDPLNSNSAQWVDYDNDGKLDLFVCCELQPNHLYHNEGNGRFIEAAGAAGLLSTREQFCKGATWIDYDGDDYPDVFLNYLDGGAHLFHNDQQGHFTDVTQEMGINGPQTGFSCWAFDYDNDGWPDIFATCYQRTPTGIVKGLIGVPHPSETSRLFHNLQGKRFEDVTRAAGLDLVFSTMGSNFADFDNDGFLDMYLATGEPNLATLVPNRMFRNVGGRRFSEITGTSGTGHLQKGHGVACGDWDRDGNVDLFVELGGAVPGDQYHNLLFQNPGHPNGWVTVKLVGEKSNRAAIGARIKIVTDAETPQTVYRWVSSGSSFGANPLQQTIGLGKARRVKTLEVHWPTSHTTQVFHDLAIDQALEIHEFAASPKELHWKKLPTPRVSAPAASIASR